MMISKPRLIPSAACLFAIAISSALFADSPATLPWNGGAHLSPESLKIHYVRSALKKLDFEITEGARATHDKQVVLERPSRCAMEANIVRVGLPANPFAIRILECEVEYNSEVTDPEENSTFKVSVGLIYTQIDGGTSGNILGRKTIHQHQGQLSKYGVGITQPGRYRVTAFVLGQEIKDGPWYLLDNFHGLVNVEK